MVDRGRLFDAELVRQAVSTIRTADQVIEVRLLDAVIGSGGWPATWSGYYNDPDKVVDSLGTVRSATGIYLTINPVNPALLARANNRLRKAPKGESTNDTDILRRRWLLVDTDAQRPSGISASEQEHQAALQCAQEVQAYFTSLGWPEPIVADSGNGGHLMYRIDLPTDDGGLVQRVLAALAEKFDDDCVKIDTKVFNPARIWKLYGTRACKGDDVPDRPHRMSRILSVPESLTAVTQSQLEHVAATLPPNLPANAPKPSNGTPFDLETFISQHGLDVEGPQAWSGRQGTGERWTFRTSPLCDHNDGAAFLLRHASGAITAQCHHNSCSWDWAQLRNRYEPVDTTPLKPRKNEVVSTSAPQRSGIQLESYVPFPVNALPAAVGKFVQEAADAIGCDSSFVALPTLACLARVIGNKRVIRLKRTWAEPAILWMAIVGKSGTHKSPAIQAGTQFLEELQAQTIEEYEQALQLYDQEKALYEKDHAQWKRLKTTEPPPWPPAPPVCTRYIVSDITIEALAERLDTQFDGVLVVRDELAGWVNGIGEYKGGRGSDNGHWLSTWSGAPMTMDRKTTTKKMIHVPRAAVSIVGGIQPGILRLAIGREHMQDGLCARLLLAMPTPRPVRWTEAVVSEETEAAIAEIYDRLRMLDPAANSEGKPEPYPLLLTPEAKRIWVEHYNRHREEQTGLDDDLAAAWSKLEAYAARFALIFQLCSWAAGEASGDEVDQQSMESAIEICKWFGGEAKRVYAVMVENEEDRELRELADLIRRKGGTICSRALMRSSRRYPKAEDAEAALNDLAKAGWGTWETIPAGREGGRASREFRIVDTADVDTTS